MISDKLESNVLLLEGGAPDVEDSLLRELTGGEEEFLPDFVLCVQEPGMDVLHLGHGLFLRF